MNAMTNGSMDPNNELLRRLDLLLQTGCLLMESAADTMRTLRNMKRAAQFMGLPEQQMQIYVNYNMLMVNMSTDDETITKFHLVVRHGIDLDVLRKVSLLTQEARQRGYSLDAYEQSLEDIRHPQHDSSAARPDGKNYSPWQVAVGGGLACGGFCIQFGCDWLAFFYASIAAILGLRLRMWLNEKGSNPYVNIGIAAFTATLIAWLFSFLPSETPWHPLMACTLFIVPGVPLINFVSDMLAGYTQIGITRAVNTLLIVLAMAFGIAFAIQVCGIDNFVRNLSMTPHHEYNEYMLSAAISAVGFSMIFNVPRRLMGVVSIGGIGSVCTRNLVSLGASSGNIGLDLGPVVGSFCGSALISIICCLLIRRLKTPHQCLSIPSVIPMIPGVLMYRSLFAFIDMHGVVGEVTVAMNNGIRASLIILCIAMGVAIPNIFFRRLITR